MAKLPGTFNSDNHDDMRGSFDPIPAGEYPAHVTKSSIEDTKKKDGKYIKLEFTVLDGESKGRKLWSNLNIVNPSEIAMKIAQEELATICRACGKKVVADTLELHEIPLVLTVKEVAAKGDYPPTNDITGYAPAGGTAKKSETTPASNGVPWA